MAIFGIETSKEPEVKEFMRLSNERLNNKTIIYKGTIKEYESFYLVEMKPLMFEFYWLGVMGLLSAIYFIGLSWMELPLLALSSCFLLWNKHFYYFMLKLGLMKARIKSKVTLLSTEELIKRLIQSANQM